MNHFYRCVASKWTFIFFLVHAPSQKRRYEARTDLGDKWGEMGD